MFLHFKALNHHRHSSNVAPLVRRVRVASLLLALPLLLVASQKITLAQEPEPDEVLRVRTDLITVPLFVTDRSGRRIGGLQKQDFVVRDEGREVETAYFSYGTDR